jgi:uncharacterized protein (DUF433 family)
MIDWSRCPDVESVPGRCSGAWVVKDSRVIVQSCILGNAEADQTPLQIARMFSLPVATVRKVLRFAYQSELQSLTDARRRWPNLPRDYQRRADVLTGKLAELARALRPRPTRKPLPR